MTTQDTLYAAVDGCVNDVPDELFCRFIETEYSSSRSDLWMNAHRLADGFRLLGVERGDRVATLLDNGMEILEVFLSCGVAGYIWVPFNTALPSKALSGPLSEVEPTLFVVDQERLGTAEAALKNLEIRPRLVVVPQATEQVELRPEIAGHEDYRQVVSGSQVATGNPGDVSTPLAIMYTSGTTGPSKGVTMPNGQVVAMAGTPQLVMGYDRDDVLYGCLPLYHGNAIFTTFLPGLLAGSQVSFSQRFSASRFWHRVVQTEATALSLLGSMIPILWQRDSEDVEQEHRVSRSLVIPRPEHFRKEFEERFGFPTTELYGLTDAGNVLGIPAGDDRIGSCGKLVPGWEAKLVDEMDYEVPVGEVGELTLRPREPFTTQLGYWRRPEATVRAWRNLWFHTGDLLRRDADGWYYFSDRSKDSIRRFGENVSAFEVESALLSHSGVLEAAVYGVPSEFAEEEVMAAVVVKTGHEIDPSLLIEHCRQLLPYFAVPRYFDFVDALPKTTTEKIRKSELRSRGVTEATWDRGPTGRSASRK